MVLFIGKLIINSSSICLRNFCVGKLTINTNAGIIRLHYMSAGYSTSISIKKMSNITQVFPNERYMATMNRAVIAAGLDQVLSSTGPFTVFVPSDLAFGKLESSAFANLFKPENKVMLTDLLNHHIVPGKYEFKDLKEGTKLNTLAGK